MWERLARCTTPPAHSPPLLPSSGCLTQIQTLRIASTQALIDAVTVALPSPPLLPSLYIPLLVDRRDNIPEYEQPPRKRLYLSTLGSRYEVRESSTARPTRGQGIDYGFVSTVDADERRQGIRDVGHGIRDTWDLYALLEDAQDWRPYGWWRRMPMLPASFGLALIGIEPGDSSDLQTHRDHVYAQRVLSTAHTQLQLQSTLIQTQHQVHETRFHMQQTELTALRETDRRRQEQMVETLRVIRDMRREMSDMQAELLALREQRRTAGQSGPELGFQITRRDLGTPTVTSSDLCYCILLGHCTGMLSIRGSPR
ncbi:hypothetical protein Tco_0834105 [Tanacetum coccineum]